MSNFLREVTVQYTDFVKNSNKFWRAQLNPNHSVHVEWGRTGGTTQSQDKSFGSQSQANSFIDKKMNEKLAKGYREVKLESSAPTTGSVGNSKGSAPVSLVKEVAKEQIVSNDPEVKKLVEYLVQQNVHDILANTKGVSYDTKTGLFSTPLGVVTATTIDDARTLLSTLSTMVEAREQGKPNFAGKLQDYMMLIPMDVGYRRLDARQIMPDVNAVRKQSQVLDSLEASLDMIAQRRKAAIDQAAGKGEEKAVTPSIFDVSLEAVSRTDAEFDRINKLYNKTLSRQHSCSNLVLDTVYRVRIGKMASQYERDGAKMTNIWELWHGTRTGNLLSILAKGFMIPPANAAHCTGRMFSDGLYTSSNSTKSLNYSYGYWGGGNRDARCFMFLCDVAMGNYYVPSSTGRHSLQQAISSGKYDSCYAQPQVSGVMNPEMIVYRTSQLNPKYLCRFAPAR